MTTNNSINAPIPFSPSKGGSGVVNPTAHGVLIAEGSNPYASLILGAGQILIGTTSGDPVSASLGAGDGISILDLSGDIQIKNEGVLSIEGTINQIYASAPDGDVVLSLPQDINTSSTPTFFGMHMGGGLVDNVDILQFNNDIQKRKLVLFDNSGGNNHQFYGLGLSTGVFEFHLSNYTDDYVWYAGIDENTSTEAMRLTGDGFLGLSVSAPHALLHLPSANNPRKIVLAETANNDNQIKGFGTGTGELQYRIASTSENHVFYAAASDVLSNELARITGAGFLGIGVNAPHARLHLANDFAVRKIILHEDANNDFEFDGLGYTNDLFIFNIGDSDHRFGWLSKDAGIAHATEIMTLKADGSLGLGLTNPQVKLQFQSVLGEKIRFYQSAGNQHQVYGVRVDSGSLAFQVDSTSSIFSFWGGVNSLGSNLYMQIGNDSTIVNRGTFWPNRLPSACMSMEGNSTGTTISSAANFFKIAGTTTTDLANQFDSPSSNRLRYIGSPAIVADVMAIVNASHDQASTSLITIAIYKNGSRVTRSNEASSIGVGQYQSIKTQFLVTMSTNDYIEIFVAGPTLNEVVTVANMQVIVTTT